MIVSRDQLNREICLPDYPQKIISLVPSISELLWDLNLQNELCGITKFCIHPEIMFRSKPVIGGTKNINIDRIRQLQPDLIIANKEENTKTDIELLAAEFPVWISDVNTFDEALHLIHETGILCNRKTESEKIISEILSQRKSFLPTIKVLYFIWHKPDYAAGKNTFIDAMLNEAGFENCLTEKRYPEITPEEIKELHPEYIFLSSEPFPFSEKHQNYFREMFPNAKIYYVNGEMFSWYGSGMRKAFRYFEELRNNLQERG